MHIGQNQALLRCQGGDNPFFFNAFWKLIGPYTNNRQMARRLGMEPLYNSEKSIKLPNRSAVLISGMAHLEQKKNGRVVPHFSNPEMSFNPLLTSLWSCVSARPKQLPEAYVCNFKQRARWLRRKVDAVRLLLTWNSKKKKTLKGKGWVKKKTVERRPSKDET